MTTPNPNDNGWSANKWLPTGNKPDGSGLAGFSTRDKNGWGNGILGIFGDSAPKSQAITEGLFTNWLGAAGNPDDPLLNPQADKNLILNGGFEASVGWTWPAGGSRDATVGRTAAGSAKIVANGSLQALTSASVAVVEGQLILLGAYAKWSGIVGSAGATLVLQCFSASTLLLEQEIAQFTPAGAGGWQELQATFVIPAACDNVKLLCEHTATSGTLWWDDVSVRKKIDDKVDEAQTTAGNASTKADNIIDAVIKGAQGLGAGGNPLTDMLGKLAALFGIADGAHTTATQTNLGILRGWNQGSTADVDMGVYNVFGNIKTALAAGYSVETVTSSKTWTKPSGLSEIVIIGVGSGQSGPNGRSGVQGGPQLGGLGGGYTVLSLRPDAVSSSVSITIGTGGAATSFGSYVVTGAGVGGIAGTFGFTPTNSTPGRGGSGGWQDNSSYYAATAGESTPLSTGGTAGTPAALGGNNGNPGGAGANVDTTVNSKSGAGGGGGGSAGTAYSGSVAYAGGNGGNGGYPGGGGGAGGDKSAGIGTGSPGTGGNGGNGIMFIFTK